jgi:hypothetical protein
VPRISVFYGISIWMCWNEGAHARPHFHARYGEHAASVDFDGELVAGSLPRRALALVAEWRPRTVTSWPRTGSALGAKSRSRRSTRSRKMTRMEPLVDITEVELVAPYRLRLTFADGTVGDVDFTTREWRGVFEPLRDPGYFARVHVDPEAGTIAWPGNLDMAPEPLYDEARRHLVTPATA